MDDVSAIVAGILSDDPSSQLESTTNFRKFLSLERIPITEEIQSVLVPRFIAFLEKEDSPKLQYEAAWIITNIAHDKPEIVIDHDAVPILVKLLASPNDDVSEQAVWALGNVAGCFTQNRDYVLLNCGALLPLCSLLNKDTAKMSMLRIGTWTLLNFCRGMPRPLFDQVKPALPTIERLLHLKDEDLWSDACVALWYMSYGSDDGIQSVIEAGFVPILVQLFGHTSPHVFTPVRGIICAVLSVDNQQIQCVIDGCALPILANLLIQDSEKSVKMEACWMITNIALGTEEQIQILGGAESLVLCIPGFALLALVLEHEACKNIPVISTM